MAIVTVDKVCHWLISSLDLVLHVASVVTAARLTEEHPLAAVLEALHDAHGHVV